MAKTLEVKDLHVNVAGRRVLRGVNLRVEPGTIHVLMGPNGSGKSTLAYTIMGREGYRVEKGEIILGEEDITELPTEERALKGLFLAFQEPPAVPGVRYSSFLIAMINKRRGEDDLFKLSDPRILKRIYELLDLVGLPRNALMREVNRGFSGGEKKRSEMLQALLLEPEIVILDEPDSGLDVDGVRKIASIIKSLRESGKGILLITHYARLLEYLQPDRVSVLVDGRIVASGGPELAERIEREGYNAVATVSEG